MQKIALLFLIILFAGISHAQSDTIFKGLPILKISEGGISRVVEKIRLDTAVNLKCIISKIGNSYYWASRENVELMRIDSGIFITFIAPNGSGYIRTLIPDFKESASLMLTDTEAKYDYVEHLLFGLRSVTFYGMRE